MNTHELEKKLVGGDWLIAKLSNYGVNREACRDFGLLRLQSLWVRRRDNKRPVVWLEQRPVICFCCLWVVFFCFFFQLVICMSRWLCDLPTQSIVKKCNTAGGERASKAQARSATDQGNEKGEEKNHDRFDVKPQRTAVVPYRDPCWARPTTAWTCPDGTLPSRSWPGCQTCSGRPCGPPMGWRAAGEAASAVCGGRHAHLLHLGERLGVKTEADESHPGTENEGKQRLCVSAVIRTKTALLHSETMCQHKATPEKSRLKLWKNKMALPVSVNTD